MCQTKKKKKHRRFLEPYYLKSVVLGPETSVCPGSCLKCRISPAQNLCFSLVRSQVIRMHVHV